MGFPTGIRTPKAVGWELEWKEYTWQWEWECVLNSHRSIRCECNPIKRCNVASFFVNNNYVSWAFAFWLLNDNWQYEILTQNFWVEILMLRQFSVCNVNFRFIWTSFDCFVINIVRQSDGNGNWMNGNVASHSRSSLPLTGRYCMERNKRIELAFGI